MLALWDVQLAVFTMSEDPKPGDDKSPKIEASVAPDKSKLIAIEAQTDSKPISHVLETSEPDLDDFGLPLKRHSRSSRRSTSVDVIEQENGDSIAGPDATPGSDVVTGRLSVFRRRSRSSQSHSRSQSVVTAPEDNDETQNGEPEEEAPRGRFATFRRRSRSTQNSGRSRSTGEQRTLSTLPTSQNLDPVTDTVKAAPQENPVKQRSRNNTLSKIPEHLPNFATGGVSEWSHQALAPREVEVEEKKEDEWQDMPAYGKYDVYDDEGKLVARGTEDSEDEADVYDGLGGAGKGYTRVQIDDDAKSATSMDEDTSYLFREKGTNVVDEDEEQRDPLAQMQATKDLLTEGQRIAYVGVTRLAMVQMVNGLEELHGTKAHKKELGHAVESMKMWGQKMMVRLYGHMGIDSSGT